MIQALTAEHKSIGASKEVVEEKALALALVCACPAMAFSRPIKVSKLRFMSTKVWAYLPPITDNEYIVAINTGIGVSSSAWPLLNVILQP